MNNYIDGFVFPIPQKHLSAYQAVGQKVAAIWQEHGALAYCEYVGDDMHLQGTQSFTQMVNATADEVIVFGYVVFPSKEVRDLANQKVKNDARMNELVAPLVNPNNIIFNAQRMVFGGFKALV